MTSPLILRAIRACRQGASVLSATQSATRGTATSTFSSRVHARDLRIALPSPNSWATSTPCSWRYDYRLSHVYKPRTDELNSHIIPRTFSNGHEQKPFSSPLSPITILSSPDNPDRRTDRPPHLRRRFSASTRRQLYTGRLQAGVEKRRTHRVRSFASEPSSASASREADGKVVASTDKSAKNGKGVTWREALKSPRKAIAYAGQLRRDIVDWAKHMWAGAKLLAADVRVSYKILKRVTSGKEITRRERTFIVQTGVDLARLVPFSLFLIIPLAEFALPFALRLFPNMLPSQFQDHMKEAEDLKRRLQARLELAKYLREVVEEKAKLVKASDANSVRDSSSIKPSLCFPLTLKRSQVNLRL